MVKAVTAISARFQGKKKTFFSYSFSYFLCLSSILSPGKKVNWLFDTNPIYQLSNHAIPSPVFAFGAIVTVWGGVDVIGKMKISRQFLQQINTVSLERNSTVFALLFNNKWVILYWLKKRKNKYKKSYLWKNKY